MHTHAHSPIDKAQARAERASKFARVSLTDRVERVGVTLAPLMYKMPVRFGLQGLTGLRDPMLGRLETLVDRRGRAVDVGANNGMYAYALMRLSESVEAFEPQPLCVESLRAYAARNARLHVHQCGLSDHDGEATLYVPIMRSRFRNFMATGLASLHETNGDAKRISVALKRLDDFAFDDVSFIKIDVEGHESAVIDGAAATIARCRPTLLVEIEQRHLGSPIEAVFSAITGMGYRGFFFEDGALRDIAEFSEERHQRIYLDDITSAVKRDVYINNFVFKPL